MSQAPPSPFGPDYAGLTLDGRYRLGGLIGRGGSASVHAGVDLRLRREVAVKVIHPEHARSEEQRRRIRSEAIVGASLDHPYVVPILDFGALPLPGGEHRAYLVMPLLRGVTLRGLILEGRIAWPRALRLARQLLSGLRALHDRGVIHRDLKSCNCFVVREEGREILRILDFGLAKVTREGLLSRLPSASASGVILGTPAYLAPEQVRGQAIDERADLYAVGVILFEALTRRLPFVGADFDVMSAHVGRPPPTLRSIVGDGVLPEKIEEVVARALAKDPAERFGSAAAFDEALARVLAEAGEGAESIEIERTASACPPAHAGCCEAQASLAAWTCFEYTRAVEAWALPADRLRPTGCTPRVRG